MLGVKRLDGHEPATGGGRDNKASVRLRGCVVRICLSVTITTPVGLMIDGYETPRGPRRIQISAREIGTGMSDPPRGVSTRKKKKRSILRPPSAREKFQSLAPFSSEVAPRLQRKGRCAASGSPWLALPRLLLAQPLCLEKRSHHHCHLQVNTFAATSPCAFNWSAALAKKKKSRHRRQGAQ